MYSYALLKQLNPKDEEDINSFLQQKNGFNYFQSPSFFHIYSESKKFTPYYIIARNGYQIIGILLICRQIQFNVPIISFLTSRTLIVGGPVLKEYDNKLIENFIKTYKKKVPLAIYTQIRNMSDTSSLSETLMQHKFNFDDHLNIIINLTCSEEALWKNINSKRRNEIKRAEKEGCTVEIQTSLDALRSCYSILKEVYQRAKIPLPDFSHFKALLQFTTDQAGLRVFTAMWDGKIIGCMLCLAHNNTLYDYYAGAYMKYYSKHPNDLLPWEVFKWGQRNGFDYFDFGGAGKPGIHYGVRDYKKKFGGTFVNYGRYEQSHFPILYKLITSSFKVYQRIFR